ncbi:MAG TPA: DUF4396 domain-containing protein [Chloroflexota bacterium]|nr:DUF4396 domain-containing protein [Chloroflexota bacterium]
MTPTLTTLDGVLLLWFGLTALSVLYVAYDLFVHTPEMTVMKWGWIAVTAYTGPLGLFFYLIGCKEPLPGTHERLVAAPWRQALGSTIHCLAGDATGVIFAAAVTAQLRLPMALELVTEYVFGFAFGLFIFQALFMRDMLGGSYWQAVRRTFLPELISMNMVMAGMIPVMVALMNRDMSAMEPAGLRFWGVMSLATIVGGALAYPANAWMVRRGLKHGMGTVRALGTGGHELPAERYEIARKTGEVPLPPASTAPGAMMPAATGHGVH